MSYLDFGPGDEVTWGPYLGHALDPRAPDDDDDLQACAECDEEFLPEDLSFGGCCQGCESLKLEQQQ